MPSDVTPHGTQSPADTQSRITLGNRTATVSSQAVHAAMRQRVSSTGRFPSQPTAQQPAPQPAQVAQPTPFAPQPTQTEPPVPGSDATDARQPAEEKTSPAGDDGTASDAASQTEAKSPFLSFLRPRSGFARHPRNSPVWRWWRPLITAPLMFVYYILVLMALMFGSILLGVTDLESIMGVTDLVTQSQASAFFSVEGAIVVLGGLGVLTLVCALALWTSRERPFGTLLSVYGHLRWGLLLRALPFAFVTFAAPMLLEIVTAGGFSGAHAMQVAPVVLVMVFSILPLQCVAEEVLFRGYVMQTTASWVPKVGTAVALIVQATLFMLGHAYDVAGQIAIFCTGLTFGWLAEKTGGLEGGIAFHIANNVLAFVAMYFGLADVSSQVPLIESLIDSVASVAMPVLFAYLAIRRGWIDEDAVVEAGQSECRMFGSQRDAIMWEKIQAQQMEDWNRFVSDMPSVMDGQDDFWQQDAMRAPDQVQAVAYLPDGQYVDGEATVIGTDDSWYDDQIIPISDTGSQPPVDSGAYVVGQPYGTSSDGDFGVEPMPQGATVTDGYVVARPDAYRSAGAWQEEMASPDFQTQPRYQGQPDFQVQPGYPAQAGQPAPAPTVPSPVPSQPESQPTDDEPVDTRYDTGTPIPGLGSLL